MPERLTGDIAGDLRAYGSPLAVEAADKLDGLLALLAAAETARDRALADLKRRTAQRNDAQNARDGWLIRWTDQRDELRSVRAEVRRLTDDRDAARADLALAKSRLHDIERDRGHDAAELDRLATELARLFPVEAAAANEDDKGAVELAVEMLMEAMAERDDALDLVRDRQALLEKQHVAMRAWERDLRRMRPVVERVRALHQPAGHDAHGLPGCTGCDDGETWPCPTIQALDATPRGGVLTEQGLLADILIGWILRGPYEEVREDERKAERRG